MSPGPEHQKEVARQEQFWFTATTLGFVGLLGTTLKPFHASVLLLALVLIGVLSVFSIYLIVGRHRNYRQLNGENVRSWWHALHLAWQEKSGTLYCVSVVLFAAIGSMLIISSRYFEFCT